MINYYVQDKMHDSRIKTIVELTNGSTKVLDIGDIRNSPLSKKLSEKFNTTTVDIRKGADIHANLNEGLKIKGKYDAVIAGEVFEHVYKLRNLLRDIKKVMKPKAKLIISIPNVCNLKSRIKVLIGRLPTYCADADEIDQEIGGHIRDLNVQKMKSILNETGFNVTVIKSNGLWYHNKQIMPSRLCKPEWSDNIILSASKK